MGYSLQVLPCRRSVISLVQAMQAWWLRKFPPIVTEVQYSTMEMNENGIYKTSTHVPFPESEEDDSSYLVDGAPTGNDGEMNTHVLLWYYTTLTHHIHYPGWINGWLLALQTSNIITSIGFLKLTSVFFLNF